MRRLTTLALAVAVPVLLTAGCSDGEPSPAVPPDEATPSEPDAPDQDPVGNDRAAEPDPTDEQQGEEEAEHATDEATLPSRDHPHLHGAWVHLFDDTLKSRAGIAAMVDELADAGATAIVAQVARRHDAYYDSAVLPRTADPDLPADLDVLEELLTVAHDRGLQVHAWLSVAPTWHDTYADLPAPDGWVATEHGHLADDDADRWVTRTADGDWSQYLDPALPEVRAHVVAVVTELVDRYAVDGIHLDYVRYESANHGYHPRAVDAYLEASGTSVVPEPTDAAWSAWRRDRATELIVEVAASLDQRAPHVLLSAATISWGPGPGHPDAPTFADTRTMTEALQDWERWALDGVVDAVMPMHYFREHDEEQRGWLRSWLAFDAELAAATETAIVPGIGGWLNAPDAVLDQVSSASRAGDGVLVYSFQQPTEDASREVWQDLDERGWGASEP